MRNETLWATMVRGRFYPSLRFRLCIVLFILTAALSSRSQPAQDMPITLNVKNMELGQVLSMIEKQSGYLFVYDEDILKKAGKVTLRINRKPLTDVLSQLFDGRPFSYRLKGRMIILVPGASVLAQEIGRAKTVRGSVKDAPRGLAIPGAQLFLDGHLVRVTDDNGDFEIDWTGNPSVLTVSSMGYKSQSTVLNSRNMGSLDIRMEQDNRIMDSVQIVSTGYSSIPKERATGSFELIDQSLFNQQASIDILGRLDAIANSVTTDKGTTTGGLMVRGLSTIKGPKDPLIVLDNFPYDGDINNINPNDVDNITILKDAAAASIWGAKAANGVIVITTKKGRYSQPVKVNFNSFLQTAAKPDLGYIRQINTSDFIEVEQYLFDKGFYNSKITSTERTVISPVVEFLQQAKLGLIEPEDAATRIDRLRNLDFRDQFSKYMYQRAFSQQYALSMQGGTDRLNWLTSLGMDRQSDNLAATTGRYNAHFNLNYKPLKNLEIGSSMYYTVYDTHSGRNGYGSVLTNSFQTYPYAQFADADGHAAILYRDYAQGYKDTAGNGRLLDWNYYPLEDYKHDYSKQKISDNIISLSAKYTLPLGLAFSIRPLPA